MKFSNSIQLYIFILQALILYRYTNGQCLPGQVNSNGVCDDCGKTFYSNNVNKIVGGVTATSGSWPAQALLFITDSTGKTYQCGGTLIKRDYVVTAAHCIESTVPSNFKIYLGVQDQTKLNDPNVVLAQAKKIIPHPSYDDVRLNNDIALIQLASPVTLSNRIQLACIPQIGQNSSYPLPASFPFSWAVGWGTTSYGGRTPAQLQNVKLNVYDGPKYCSKYGSLDWTRHICSGENLGGKDSCQGDSGGPLYVQDNVAGTVRYILAGVTSYGNGCAQKGYPGIYTRVSGFYNWINSIANIAIYSTNSVAIATPIVVPIPTTTSTRTFLSTILNTISANGLCLAGQVNSNGVCDYCGISSVANNAEYQGFRSNSLKIIGGLTASTGSWPAQVFIVVSNKYYCGGTLIKRNYVLTSASCLQYSSNPASYSIYLGAQDITQLASDSNVVLKIASKLIANPTYNSKTFDDNIGLIQLSSPVTLNSRIQLACLPQAGQSSSYPLPSSFPNAWAVGWGTLTKSSSYLSNFLQNVQLKNYDGTVYCFKYGSVGLNNINWTKHICSGLYSGGRDSCKGDTGGPLYVQDNVAGTVRYVLAGITSAGYGCANSGFPGIYTRVSNYYNWIQLNAV